MRRRLVPGKVDGAEMLRRRLAPPPRQLLERITVRPRLEGMGLPRRLPLGGRGTLMMTERM